MIAADFQAMTKPLTASDLLSVSLILGSILLLAVCARFWDVIAQTLLVWLIKLVAGVFIVAAFVLFFTLFIPLALLAYPFCKNCR